MRRVFLVRARRRWNHRRMRAVDAACRPASATAPSGAPARAAPAAG
jgi:hypothetical protein